MMAIIYSYIEDKYIDLDCEDAVFVEELNDWIHIDNTKVLLEQYDAGNITQDQMIELGFDLDEDHEG